MIQFHLQYSKNLCTINIKEIVYFYPKDNGTRIVFVGNNSWVNVTEDYNKVHNIIDAEWNKLNQIKGEN